MNRVIYTHILRSGLQLLLLAIVLIASSCNDMYDKERPTVFPKSDEAMQLYILSEGLFNMNNSTLSKYDFTTGHFVQDHFRATNKRGLGDTGNDMALYGSKLYVVVNVSSQVEVLDAATGKSIAQIPLFNEQQVARQPRQVVFQGSKAYVNCFDGYVVRIDTASLQVDGLVKCGRNPDGMAISNNKLYVANSGGLDFPNYDHTLSVVDLNSFTELKRIDVGMNPGKVGADELGNVYVVLRGNYEDVPYQFVRIDAKTDAVVTRYDRELSPLNFTIHNNQIYMYSYDYNTQESWLKLFDCATQEVITHRFIQDGTQLQTPYGIQINPYTDDVYVTEAYNFTIWGDVLCFDQNGRLKYRLNEVGLNPSRVVFIKGGSAEGDSVTDNKGSSPYINRVYSYLPAPGQFMNTATSAYKAGFTEADVLDEVNKKLLQDPSRGSLVSLGSWGGSIVVGFDHTIPNVVGAYDFKVYGNSFSGSSEPGIVLVMRDENKNGLPDDTWYELAGSEYHNPATRHGYEVTYYRPQNVTDTVRWTNNFGESGVVERNRFHRQGYFPAWILADSYTLSGSRLADNGVNVGTTSEYWVQTAYAWGYADNQPNSSEFSQFKIDWAVDANGKPVQLKGIDFIKVYSAIQQNCGWIGENSTEFCNAEDLHFEREN